MHPPALGDAAHQVSCTDAKFGHSVSDGVPSVGGQICPCQGNAAFPSIKQTASQLWKALLVGMSVQQCLSQLHFGSSLHSDCRCCISICLRKQYGMRCCCCASTCFLACIAALGGQALHLSLGSVVCICQCSNNSMSCRQKHAYLLQLTMLDIMNMPAATEQMCSKFVHTMFSNQPCSVALYASADLSIDAVPDSPAAQQHAASIYMHLVLPSPGLSVARTGVAC